MIPVIVALFAALATVSVDAHAVGGNRLAYLDEQDPFYVHRTFPKLATPQWVGESNVQAVVVLAIDDMRDPAKYEAYLRPILNRLKQIDGRAALSIMCNALDTQNAQLQAWLQEGVSLEVHTLTHPCPLLARSNFVAAANNYHGGVDLLNHVPGNNPVAFRMPCCDSINSPSPRFYAEIFSGTNSSGQFLALDSSIMNITTPKDADLPREWVFDRDGKERFRKYIPFPSFVTTIEDYPYPYVIGRLGWEFPGAIPSDWEAQNLHGTNNPATIEDWKIALDIAVRKQGTFNLIFHPHGWIRNDQIVELIDYAVQKHGNKVKFLNFREALERLNRHLLLDQPLRATDGQDNGVRLMDLNHDGYLDVVIGNAARRVTRIWNPRSQSWSESGCPFPVVQTSETDGKSESGVRFGVVKKNGNVTALLRTEAVSQGWQFDGQRWVEDRDILNGLEMNGRPVLAREGPRDRGVRFRDVDNDGHCELMVSNDSQNALFAWSEEARIWKRLPYSLPEGASLVDAEGRDAGLRFVDLNKDGYDDILFSNEQSYGVYLFIAAPKPHLGWERGWTFRVQAGRAGEAQAIPPIVRAGDHGHNGAWFHSDHLWIQNEDTAHLPDLVDRRSFKDLLVGVEPLPKSPEESLKSIRVRPGFSVELVASEPLVIDPVAFEWGPDGKLWVVEMRDYPLGMDGRGTPGGVVKFLEDTDGDGRYDKATVFLDNLKFPSGVMPWRGGVLVSAAPEIFHAEDTNGDGKADVRRTILTGFTEGNQQHRVNGFELGLDGWVYAANGDSGGNISSVKTGRTASMRSSDLRFDPDSGRFEIMPGQTQFGRRRDDWGNWFGNNNPTWLWHYLIPGDVFQSAAASDLRENKQVLANYPNPGRVFAISPLQQRFNWPDATRQVTSANSPTPYRDDLFGPEFASSLFISEPANNVIHREVLAPGGASFTSRRADDEQETEFLASTDNWFRPTMLKVGPDGALYVADMYRLVLEHPEYFPNELKNRPDLRAGDDRGRLYRIAPSGAARRPIPRFDAAKPLELVAALESSNGWQRDTAQRLLLHSYGKDRNGKAVRVDRGVASALESLVHSSSNAKTRIQALWTRHGMEILSPDEIQASLQDPHPAVRQNAVQLAQSVLSDISAQLSKATRRSGQMAATNTQRLIEELSRLAEDRDAGVRYQLAWLYVTHPNPQFQEAFLKLAFAEDQDPHLNALILGGATKVYAEESLRAILDQGEIDPFRAQLLCHLLKTDFDGIKSPAWRKIVQRLSDSSEAWQPWQMPALGSLLDGLESHQTDLRKLAASAEASIKNDVAALEPLFAKARRMAADRSRSAEERAAAISVLARGPNQRSEDVERLRTLLTPQEPQAIQNAALMAMQRSGLDGVQKLWFADWPRLGTETKQEIVLALLTRPEWIGALFDEVEQERIRPAEVSLVARQRLTRHPNTGIRARAERWLAPAAQDRDEILKRFAVVETLPGDVRRGRELFEKNCQSCHRLGGIGTQVGPDLETMSDKSVASLLVAILAPNQAIESKYLQYTAITRDATEFTGIVESESPANVVMRGAGGIEKSIPRRELQELTSTGQSLMPEGFEQGMTAQDLADLIDFVRNPLAP